MQRVKARAPSSFKAQVIDTEKRLNILFDHLNNEDLLKEDTLQDMIHLAQALHSRNFDLAQSIHVELMTNKTDECGNWMVSYAINPHTPRVDTNCTSQVGVKRLIGMSKATP
jgi:protein transport protein SEC31